MLFKRGLFIFGAFFYWAKYTQPKIYHFNHYVYSSVALSTSTMSGNQRHCLFPELLIIPNRSFVTIKQQFPILNPQALTAG